MKPAVLLEADVVNDPVPQLDQFSGRAYELLGRGRPHHLHVEGGQLLLGFSYQAHHILPVDHAKHDDLPTCLSYELVDLCSNGRLVVTLPDLVSLCRLAQGANDVGECLEEVDQRFFTPTLLLVTTCAIHPAGLQERVARERDRYACESKHTRQHLAHSVRHTWEHATAASFGWRRDDELEAVASTDRHQIFLITCPFRRDREWRLLRDSASSGWADAVEFDRAIRSGNMARVGQQQLQGEAYGSAAGQVARFWSHPPWSDGIGSCRQSCDPPYLHQSLVPLDQLDLSTPVDHGQGVLFDDRLVDESAAGVGWPGPCHGRTGTGPYGRPSQMRRPRGAMSFRVASEVSLRVAGHPV